MPTTDGPIGALTVPVSAGYEKQKIEDPAVEALLQLAAFSIKDALDDRLQNLTGTPYDACPVANRHSFDPLEPRGIQVRIKLPALFVFWSKKSMWEEQTMLYATRLRMIEFMYVFSELPSFAEMERRSGLFSAVDAALFKMSVHQARADYAHSTDVLGTWINTTISRPNFMDWEWQGSFPGRFGIDEGPRAERRAAKRSGRDFPALKGSWKLSERVALRDTEDPADLLTDTPLQILGSDGETTETIDLMDRILTAPDGSEKL